MKKLLSLMTLVTLTSALAHADLYEDRMRAAQQVRSQNAVQKLISEYKQGEVKRMNEIIAFGRQHSGYAAAPDCVDYGYRMNGSSWRSSTYQSCAGNFCVDVKSGSASYVGHENDPEYVQAAIMGMGIATCRVVLKNGLACEIGYQGSLDAFGGRCIDANGRQSVLKLK